MQIRADSFHGEVPPCPRGASQCRVHRHGWYERFCRPAGGKTCRILRFVCRSCGITFSVLPVGMISYRPLELERLQAFLDRQAGMGAGPDPPAGQVEKGCLERAWTRFQSRVAILKRAFGQLLPSTVQEPQEVWLHLRQRFYSLDQILGYLAGSCKISLLADYACLRLPLP